MPKMENHESRVTTHHGYDEERGEIHLIFKSGETHAYKVPKAVYEQFLQADSKGQFFNRILKPLPFRRIR